MTELCKISVNLFSTVANSIGSSHQINMSKSDLLGHTIEKQESW